jgi:hypothetical protein
MRGDDPVCVSGAAREYSTTYLRRYLSRYSPGRHQRSGCARGYARVPSRDTCVMYGVPRSTVPPLPSPDVVWLLSTTCRPHCLCDVTTSL